MTIDVLTYGEAMGALQAEWIGPLRMGGSMRLAVAGAESTVAIGVSRLGGTARWIGAVGDDEVGVLVQRTLSSEGVVTDGMIVRPDLPTGLMLRERRTSTSARVVYHRRHGAGATLAPEHVRAEDVAQAKWLHVTGITPALSTSACAAVALAVELARAHGTRVSFDLNHRSRLWSDHEAIPVLRGLVEGADLVLATLDEAQMLTGGSRDSAVAAAGLGMMGPSTVVIKNGAEGALAWHEGSTHVIMPVPVVLVDPVGAGDAFAAGLLADLAAGRSLEEALHTAATVAAINVACEGDWEGLPARRDIEELAGDDVVR